MAAHQAPPSLGFSRQEHWSGLPFPSPMHESEKWKWSRSVMSDSLRLHGLQPTRLLHNGFSRQEYWSGAPLPSLKFRLDMLNWIPLGSSRGGFERWSILFRGQVWAGMINIFVLCILGINWNSRSGLNDLIWFEKRLKRYRREGI